MKHYSLHTLKLKILKQIPKIRYYNRGYWLKLKKYTQFFILKLIYPSMPKITGIELSNYCCLQCPNCPTPITKFHKGFASDENIKLALKYGTIMEPFSFHRHGEPFMHKDFLKYLEIATNMGFRTIVSTNGILLDDEKIKKLSEIRPYDMEISLHTKDSVIAFKKMTEYMIENDIEFNSFYGNVLSHNEDDVYKWLDELEVSKESRKYLRRIYSHSWAGNVESRKSDYDEEIVKRRVKTCYFIKNDYVSVRWDGSIVACCMDSENETVIGELKNAPQVRQNKKGYDLCRHCDASWVNKYEAHEIKGKGQNEL